ncbi:gamma-secretase subunit aph-1, putative [Schistosoma mansoni]|uniref:Gamma-secretase subunit aph-1, putative n=1 Tax=Schistosoma mansoni TaxID=6183 RepID=G4LWL5_SCHMA|nr:gamma-secretase subunit aph-1, putative [Schistosoma mansoni]|eukprot:XP_018645655.1 gamma-secretase subunit aph-1, putative [Schistosoma mansoni]
MTCLGGVGCTLIGVGPCLILFLCTVANCPIKVILLTASGFFWLVSLLITSVMWFIVTPLRAYLAFGILIGVLIQEILRFLFFLLIFKAESGLQLIVSSSTTPVSRPQLVDGINNDNIIDNHSHGREAERNEVSNLTRNRKISSSNIIITNDYDHNILNDNNSGDINNNNNHAIQLDHLTVAYVSGLGYGLMSCIIQSLRILIDSYGPGITIYSTWNSRTFFLFSSCQCMCISMLQVFWSLILFSAFVQRAYGQIILVYFMHFGLAGMSLINTYSSPCSEIVCAIYMICLIGMIIFAYCRFHSQLITNPKKNSAVNFINQQ